MLAVAAALAMIPLGASVQSGLFACADGQPPLVSYLEYSYFHKSDPRTSWWISSSGNQVCRDGTFLRVATSRSAPPGKPNTEPIDFPFHASAVRGYVGPLWLASLRSALAAVKAGVFEGCVVSDPLWTDSLFQVTWYGKAGRVNTFLLGSPIPGFVGPECSALERPLFEALTHVRSLGTDIFSVP